MSRRRVAPRTSESASPRSAPPLANAFSGAPHSIAFGGRRGRAVGVESDGARDLKIQAGIAGDQPSVARVQEPVPDPAEQHLEPITKADEKRDVDGAPQEPRDEPAAREP